MRYSANVDYLRLLIPYLAQREGKDQGVGSLADDLSLDPLKLAAVLEGFPTIFRKSTSAGPAKKKQQQQPKPSSSESGPWRALRSWLRAPKPSVDEKASYSLQPLTGPSAPSADRESGSTFRDEVDRLLRSIESSAEAEWAHRRVRNASVIAAIALVFAALLLSGLGQSLIGPWRSDSGAAQVSAENSRVGGFGASSGGGWGTWAGPPVVKVACSTCPTVGTPPPGADRARAVEARDDGGADVRVAGWWLPASAFALGLALFVWARRGDGARGGPEPLVTLGSALSFAGGAAAWAQPALTYKPGQAGLHNPTAAVLLILLLLAVLLLVSGFIFRGRKVIWMVPAGLVMVVLVAAGMWSGSSRANLRAGYLEPYVAASAPERVYAWMPILAGLIGLLVAGAVAYWLSGRARAAQGSEPASKPPGSARSKTPA